jgi:pyruvate formate lyase activating enzyme
MVVFFKGCPLACAWCHSPDSQALSPEILIHAEQCIGCGTCLETCRSGAAVMEGNRGAVNRARCEVCGRCVEACPAGARRIAGRSMTVRDVLASVLRDRTVFDLTGGGVTLSGGEPLMQPAFALALLEALRLERVHTAIETCGHARQDVLLRAAALADLVLFDLKLMDEDRHLAATGASNVRILENLSALARARRDVVVRLPLVPGVNDDWHNLAETAALVSAFGLSRVDLLPYHRAGIARYARLGRCYELDEVTPPDEPVLASAAGVFRSAGLDVRIGGSA